MGHDFCGNNDGHFPSMAAFFFRKGLIAQSGFCFDVFLDYVGIYIFPFTAAGAIGQMDGSDAIDLKIVIVAVSQGIKKEFNTAIPGDRGVRVGMFGQNVFLGHIVFQPNIVVITGNPEFDLGGVRECIPIQYVNGIQFRYHFHFNAKPTRS